jgi:hypothetical protein
VRPYVKANVLFERLVKIREGRRLKLKHGSINGAADRNDNGTRTDNRKSARLLPEFSASVAAGTSAAKAA